MRRPAFVYALLGSASIVSAVDYAPGQDTWCMTYLSTYLVPISNQANSPALTRPPKEPGRQPIAPSLKPTFAANISTQRTQPSFNTDFPTSIVFPESSGTAELSSDGPELSTLGTEPTVAQSGSVTQSLDPVTEPVIDEVATSSLSTGFGSTVSTDAIPTSSGFIEPAGRSVIFQVSVVDNQKRSTNKRQAIGGFVGNDNPQSCTFAATFNLADGQLFEDGAPIYYSGESYKELSGLDFPSSGSITKTFEGTGRLTFRNSGLPNGRAGFCQTPDGTVYMTFTNGPVGCISVDLVVYDVTQCQDGRLIGDDDETATPSETIPQDTATARGTDPTMTSGAEDATSVKVSYSSGDSMTQSQSIDTSLTSDPGASDMVSSDTTLTDTIITDTAITDGAITDTASMDGTLTDTIIMDTTPSTTSTIGVDVTTGVTTDTTPTAASATTAEASATTSGALSPSCNNIDNPYTASNGVTFTLSCNTLITSILLKDPYVSDFIPCLQACSEDEACVAMYFFKGGTFFDSLCYLLSYVYDEPAAEDFRFDAAFKDPVIADTTTAAADTETADTATADTTTTNTEITDTTIADTTTADTTTAETTTAETTADVPAGDTTTSVNPTETSGPSNCADLISPVQVGEDTYDTFCNEVRYFDDATEIETTSFLGCIQACSQDNSCIGVDYIEAIGVCYLAFQFSNDYFPFDGNHHAFRRGA